MSMSEELYYRIGRALCQLQDYVNHGDYADYDRDVEKDIDSLIDDFSAWWETDDTS